MQLYIICRMEDDKLVYAGNVEWDRDKPMIVWEEDEGLAGLFYGEEVDDLEQYYTDIVVEEVEYGIHNQF